MIRKITILMYPIIPESALKVLNIFDINEDMISFESIKNNKFLQSGKKMKKMSILFKKVGQ